VSYVVLARNMLDSRRVLANLRDGARATMRGTVLAGPAAVIVDREDGPHDA
jgi:hypothetical protein